MQSIQRESVCDIKLFLLLFVTSASQHTDSEIGASGLMNAVNSLFANSQNRRGWLGRGAKIFVQHSAKNNCTRVWGECYVLNDEYLMNFLFIKYQIALIFSLYLFCIKKDTLFLEKQFYHGRLNKHAMKTKFTTEEMFRKTEKDTFCTE